MASPVVIKHPLILQMCSYITELIVHHCHSKIGHHQGCRMTHNTIRQAGYWIIDGCSTVAKTILNCVVCRKLRSLPITQKMSYLTKNPCVSGSTLSLYRHGCFRFLDLEVLWTELHVLRISYHPPQDAQLDGSRFVH